MIGWDLCPVHPIRLIRRYCYYDNDNQHETQNGFYSLEKNCAGSPNAARLVFDIVELMLSHMEVQAMFFYVLKMQM